MEGQSHIKLSVPGAIVVAGILVAGAFFLSRTPIRLPESLPTPKELRAVSESDHIRGNPQAKVAFVEFSDYECPFCASFHPTVQKLIAERPDDVYWVYRHYPLTTIHSNATAAAIAAECVADLAGNDAFWTFTDALFANQPTLGEILYTAEAAQLGIDQNNFSECRRSEDKKRAVEQDLVEAKAAGASGTPYTILITPSGKLMPISGALPFDQVNQILDQALAR